MFGTVLHEDYHWYNALDAEGAKAVQNTALEYLAKSEGFENVDELIRDKVKDYAAQGLTYEQAAEELVADSWRGIFDSAESVTRWAEFQRAQAEKNAGKAGTIHKVMTAVKEMLNGIISRAKEALTLDPENRAALKAQRLAEAENGPCRTPILPMRKRPWTTCVQQKKTPQPSRVRVRRRGCGSSCTREKILW